MADPHPGHGTIFLGCFHPPPAPPPGATLGSVGAQAQRGVLTCPALLRGLVRRFLTPRKGRGAQGNVGAPRPWKKGKPFGYSSIAAACPKPLNLGFTKGKALKKCWVPTCTGVPPLVPAQLQAANSS